MEECHGRDHCLAFGPRWVTSLQPLDNIEFSIGRLVPKPSRTRDRQHGDRHRRLVPHQTSRRTKRSRSREQSTAKTQSPLPCSTAPADRPGGGAQTNKMRRRARRIVLAKSLHDSVAKPHRQSAAKPAITLAILQHLLHVVADKKMAEKALQNSARRLMPPSWRAVGRTPAQFEYRGRRLPRRARSWSRPWRRCCSSGNARTWPR